MKVSIPLIQGRILTGVTCLYVTTNKRSLNPFNSGQDSNVCTDLKSTGTPVSIPLIQGRILTLTMRGNYEAVCCLNPFNSGQDSNLYSCSCWNKTIRVSIPLIQGRILT